MINHELRKAGFDFQAKRVETREDFEAEVAQHTPDLIISDHGLPRFDGFAALALARSRCPEVPFIFVTGALGERVAIETFEKGATDYVLKNNLEKLVPAVRRALREAAERGEQRQKERALRESEERFRKLVEGVKNYAMISIDQHGKVQEWNPAAQRIFGYARAEAVEKPVDDLIIPSSLRELYYGGLTNYLISGAASLLGRPIELNLRRKNGQEFPAELAISRVAPAEPPRCTVVVRDITDRKKLEVRLRQANQKLEQRAQERGTQLKEARREFEAFCHSVSHDLRAPLRHVLGYVDILQDEAAGRLNQNDRQTLQAIVESAQLMSRLMDGLVSFSRVNRAEMRPAPVRLAALVGEARQELREEIKGRAIDWRIGPLPEVEGDPILLHQALVQLLGNALKFTRPRPRASIEIGARNSAGEVICFVRDNGVGFPMEYSGKLFGVFQRLHRQGEFEGVGTGLATVRRIINRHGGRTWAEGEAGAGATFYFSLPLKLKGD